MALKLIPLIIVLLITTQGNAVISQCRSTPSSGTTTPPGNVNDSAIYERLLNQTNANGSAIVLQAIGTLQQSGVFGYDHGILRRIAYVETRDGTRADILNSGGIWAVNATLFLQTKNIEVYTRLPSKLQQIRDVLKTDWLLVEFEDLRIPLYSAIAARLVLFIAPRAIPPENELVAQARFWVENYNSDGDEDEFIGASTGLQGSILDSSANEFFLGFSMNIAETPTTLQLFITTAENNPVTFTVNATGFSFSGVATRNSSVIVTLPTTLQVSSSNERFNGIHVKAEGDKKIVVYGLSYQMHSSDAFLALPCSRLPIDEYEYYAVTYSTSRWPSHILIVACEDNTVVNTGASTSITLNQLETYLISSSDDLTGRRITSTKPIAFFSNQECANVPVEALYCDHLTEQTPPTSTWGQFFLAASLLGRRSGELFRIIAAKTPTTVIVNCTTFAQPVNYILTDTSNWQEFEITPNSFCSISSNSSLLVTQYALGSTRDVVGNRLGDPFMMMLPPVEQFSNNYVFNVLPTFAVNYITVYVAPVFFQPDRIFVDDSPLNDTVWSQVFCSNNIICGYITRVNLMTAGEHRLYHLDQNARVGVSAYGFNTDNSYGYPGGLKLTPVQLATISFSSALYRHYESDGTVEVTVTRSGNEETLAVVSVATDSFEGTAAAGEDYEPLSVILEFLPGETEKQVIVSINDDKMIERNETFQLYLSAGEGVHLTPISRTNIIIENDDGAIRLDPSYGNMLGGTGIMVSGTQLFVSADDDILCTFDGIAVRGAYIDQQNILCISPLLSRTGRVPLQVSVDGITNFLGESTFTSLSFTRAYEVHLANSDLVVASDTEVRVQWSPESILPMEIPENYKVDIELLEMNMGTGSWNKIATLAEDIPNNGVADVRIPNIQETDTVESSFSPVVIQVALSTKSTTSGAATNLLERLGRFALKTIRNSPMRFLKKLARQAIQRGLCELWCSLQPASVGEEILNRLPPCPRRVRDARAPNSGFTEEMLSSHVPIIGNIQNYFGITLIDDAFRQFFHPNTATCFRQRVIDSASTGGSGQQCCYDGNGLLVTGPPGGGTVDLVSPDVSTSRHFLNDVLPFLLCCKAGVFSDCGQYYRKRPSDRGVDFSPPPPPPVMWGDPHILTHDGHKYTFNGKGEFTLIKTVNDSLTVQARMVPANNSLGNVPQATVFTAIVVQQCDSDRVQFEIAENGTIVLVNGERIDFTVINEQEFCNVITADHGNNTFSATFSTGVYVKVREENGFFALVIISLPEAYKGIEMSGLMGSFNGNISDDLLPSEGIISLPLNATIREIHEKFGLTWIIDTPMGSLFTYQPGDTWATFYDPFFEPTYLPTFADPELEDRARELCGEDPFCLFDVAATGDMDVGLSTLEGGREIQEIVDLQTPVVCDPPCDNGVCVENDTCHCAAGFDGSTCTEQVFSECEENPCENGGTCVRHVLSYSCLCPPNTSGDFCENTTSTDSQTNSKISLIIPAVVVPLVVLLILTILTVIVIIYFMNKRKRKEFEVSQVNSQGKRASNPYSDAMTWKNLEDSEKKYAD